MPDWSGGFPYFLQFGSKEFTIWATVSSQSCFCWLYTASPSLAAKNIINLILVLTIWCSSEVLMLKLKLQYFGHLRSRLIWRDPDAGKDWGQDEEGTTEDEMVGWHHRLNGHEFGWTPGVGDRQEDLACCSSWGCKESDMTEQLNWTELICWRPCRVFSCVVGRGCLLWLVHSLEKTLLSFSLPFKGGCHYLHYLHHSLVTGQITGRERSPTHQ